MATILADGLVLATDRQIQFIRLSAGREPDGHSRLSDLCVLPSGCGVGSRAPKLLRCDLELGRRMRQQDWNDRYADNDEPWILRDCKERQINGAAVGDSA